MAVAITDTEINPTYVAAGGGGRRALTETEINPTWFGEGGGGWNQLFETEINPSLAAPAVTTDLPEVRTWSATLNGTLDSVGGIDPCDCGFEWGPTVAYGETTPTDKKGTGDSFSRVITGLTMFGTYHFRAFAIGSVTSYGADRVFTTGLVAPDVTTDPATSIISNSATLNATLDTGGLACQCRFEYGETPAYGKVTPIQNIPIGGTSFSFTLYPLKPNTTYYFRAFATNDLGTGHGAQRSFTTLQVPYYESLISPNVQTNPATDITEHTARLNGVVVEDGGIIGAVRFQWGLTTEYGNNTSWQQGYGKGDEFFVDLNNLAEGQGFHFRAQFRVGGKLVSGSDMVFNTLFPLGPVTLVTDEIMQLLEAV